MKKVIKFRGKEINSGQWIYGFYTQGSFIGIGEVRHIIDSDHLYDFEDSVGQFTGFYDKNGKEIYEGDILKSKDVYRNVFWDSDSGAYLTKLTGIECRLLCLLDLSDYEVAGNLFDEL